MSGVLFASFAAVISFLIIWLMPKRLTPQEIYTTWGIVDVIAFILDGYFGTALHLYYFFNPQLEVWDVIFQTIMPGAFGVIVANFMPQKLSRLILYILLWTIVSICFEWIAVHFHYLNYIKWSILYSAPFYACGIAFLRWHLFFLRRTK